MAHGHGCQLLADARVAQLVAVAPVAHGVCQFFIMLFNATLLCVQTTNI